MRVRIDRGGDAVHLELGEAPVARRAEAEGGVAVAFNAAGRVVGVEVRGVGPEALQEFTVYLSGVAERRADLPPPASVGRTAAAHGLTAPAAPPPALYNGPVGWEVEAEAAVGRMAFFRRGPTRLAAIKLARARGLDRVTVAILNEAGG